MGFKRHTLKKTLLIVALLGIYYLAVAYRVGICRYQLARHQSLLFTGESALIFHYARTVSQGQSIPALDKQAQFPEGLRVKRSLSVGMELVTGQLYRLLRFCNFDFSFFVRYFTAVFFCAGIFAAYLVGRTVFADPLAGLGCSFFYAVALPAVIRSTALDISREEFSLPLIFFHIYFLLASWKGAGCGQGESPEPGGGRRKSSLIQAVFSGVFLFAALSSWEGTQVYFYFLVLFAGFKFLFGKRDSPFFFAWVVTLLFAVFAGALVPYLRAHQFLFSHSLLVSYCLLAGFLVYYWPWVRRKEAGYRWGFGRAKTAKLVFLLLVILLMVGLGRDSSYYRTYAHFHTLLFYKLRFLNQKPLDPELLPYPARILWTPALLRPSFSRVAAEFSTILLIGAVSFVIFFLRLFKKVTSGPEIFLHAAAAVFFLLYLLFSRMQVFLIFFLVLLFGEVFTFLQKRNRWTYVIGGLCLSLCLVFEGVKTEVYGAGFDRPVDYLSLEELIGWVRENTEEDAVVLSHFNHSPPLLAYAGRGIVFQPKFESPALREKVRRYAFSLFAEGEDEFHSFCQGSGADYFVFPKGTFSDSSTLGWRYLTATGPDQKSCPAYRFEYHPGLLERFLPVYENRKYRIFRIFSREEIAEAEYYQRLGKNYLDEGHYRQAIERFEKALALCPNLFSAHAGLGNAYYFMGEKEKAAQEWELIQRLRNPN